MTLRQTKMICVRSHWILATFGRKDHSSNGILIRESPEGTQLVVPDVLRQRLFNVAHSGPLAEHLGSERMLAQLRQHYYWPGMRREIQLWCRSCPGC